MGWMDVWMVWWCSLLLLSIRKIHGTRLAWGYAQVRTQTELKYLPIGTYRLEVSLYRIRYVPDAVVTVTESENVPLARP